MHSGRIVAEALRLHEANLNNSEISRRLGVSRLTISDWIRGKLPHSYAAAGAKELCERCGSGKHRFDRLPSDYVYLLGLYLGDGCISAHQRGVYRMRITLDRKYPCIIYECAQALKTVMPNNRVHAMLTVSNCYSVSAYARSWPCLFPQHGPGVKHDRPIYLAGWQQKLAERWPEQLVKGLIQPDGCRFVNTGRGGWRQPRYAFSNVSTDITGIFCSACDRLGLRWTAAFPKSESAAVPIYVSRKADVARLDELVGPKR